MAQPPALPPRPIWIGCLLLSLTMAAAFLMWWLQVSRNLSPLRVIGSVADFTLTNQAGQAVSLAGFSNQVWLADIVFTRCAGPCPRLTAQMKLLQDRLPPDHSARLVTLTTDQEFDTPAVLKKYGQHFGADFNRWTFLTGSKSEIAALAGGSLKLSAQPVNPAEQKNTADLFIHTTIFVIVDKHARLRGFFETGGDGVDWTNVVQPKILQAVQQLANEP